MKLISFNGWLRGWTVGLVIIINSMKVDAVLKLEDISNDSEENVFNYDMFVWNQYWRYISNFRIRTGFWMSYL